MDDRRQRNSRESRGQLPTSGTEDLWRARVFFGGGAFLICTHFIIGLQLGQATPTTSANSLGNASLSVILISGIITSALYFHLTRNYLVAASLTLATTWACFSYLLIFQNTDSTTASPLILCIPPLFAFLLVNFREGVIWGIAGYVALCLWTASGLGHYGSDTALSLQRATTNHIAYIGTIFIIAFYQRGNRKYQESILKAAYHDTLTGVCNRSGFLNYCEQLAGKQKSYRLVFLDINNFKPINDIFGHDVGDLTLQAFSKRISDSLRSQDFVSRIGGDEFAIIIDADDDHTALLERLARELNEPIQVGEITLDLRTSIGTADYPSDGNDPLTLLQVADSRMYEHKESSRSAAAE
ncbi:diguanylate cyclase [Spongiibacter sp. KMU-166]|uniref:Diguanylate cyclase n=1 Tax=Spongiibacter thalassae TaxID=2721624 RepID=A0ABX1GLE3_9GAMM|nr:GGDEF domain-containing protein [Spongiibacter thalassae]NKI19167.1 diguanylate cyclase [Spongiibacter thalassae]